MSVQPRKYQQMAVDAALTGLLSNLERALVVMATGLGKTLTAAFIAKEFTTGKILFLVHNNFILEHAIAEFRQVFGEETVKMSLYNGMTKNGSAEANIVFATWQTMGKNLKEWSCDHFDLVVVDEAHHTGARTYLPVIKYFTAPRLAITATPDRMDNTNIREVFGEEVVNVTLEEAIARGWLPRIEYHVITDESLDDDVLQQILGEIRAGKKRFTMAELNRRLFIRKRDEEITRMIDDRGEKAIVFCHSIARANAMAKSLKSAETFHSKKGNCPRDSQDQNLLALERLEVGLIKQVCAVNAFNEGVNVPSVEMVVFCRVTGSPNIFRQQLGRGMRPGKDKLVVLDFVGNLERIQLVREMTDRIANLHEQFIPREEIEHEGYHRQLLEVSGAGFDFIFSDCIVDLMEVIGHCGQEFYPTWQEASRAAIALGFTSVSRYKVGYKKDSQLPSNPDLEYGDFPGWGEFLGTGREIRRASVYPTWQEASKAVIALSITSEREYSARYKKDDPRLPSTPIRTYPDFPGWNVYLGTSPYSTWQEASRAVIALGITRLADYKAKYKKDPKLPGSLYGRYEDFPGWRIFIGGVGLYSTWQEASKAAIALGLTSVSRYKVEYKKDPRLRGNPNAYKDFPGWGEFLGTGREIIRRASFYPTWQEASKAVIALSITDSNDYIARYKEDPKLPSTPSRIYKGYPGWKEFLGK